MTLTITTIRDDHEIILTLRAKVANQKVEMQIAYATTTTNWPGTPCEAEAIAEIGFTINDSMKMAKGLDTNAKNAIAFTLYKMYKTGLNRMFTDACIDCAYVWCQAYTGDGFGDYRTNLYDKLGFEFDGVYGQGKLISK